MYSAFNNIYNKGDNKKYIDEFDDASYQINKFLADPKSMPADSDDINKLKKTIGVLDDILNDPSTKIDQDLKVFRGLSGLVANDIVDSTSGKIFEVGTKFKNNCFTCASGEDATAQWFMKEKPDKTGYLNFVTIEVPKGEHALYMNDLYYNNHPEQHRGEPEEQDIFRYGGDYLKEYALPRNVIFEVVDIKKVEDAGNGPVRLSTWRMVK